MYNREQRSWESASYEETVLLWCREPFNRDNPEALFILADVMLSEASREKETAEAVYQMERAAKMGYAPAAFAMGQMFQYGWAVHRSRRIALTWYEKAASLGNEPAIALLRELKQKKRRSLMAGAAAMVLVLAFISAVLRLPALLLALSGSGGIIVNRDTKLLTPVTLEEFNEALISLMEEYDDELVISGQRSTNRLMLKFEAKGIDLSDFPAAEVIADEDNYLVIQFASEEEAERCLKAMKQMDSIVFAEIDEYDVVPETAAEASAMHLVTKVPYVSDYTGYSYYSWGVEYLGMDQLTAWLQTQQTEQVTVAVIDSGTEPCADTQDRILEGMDVYNRNGSGWTDENGHGTHVAGTIFDCTRGLEVFIVPVRVFGADNAGSKSSVIQGLKFAVESGADVINMSLGSRFDKTAPGKGCGGAKDYYIQLAVEKGIVVVVSAGNGDNDGIPVDTSSVCPAHIGECIVVGACESSGNKASFSNCGKSVDVCAPGVNIISYYPNDSLTWMSGTSMAAPHISALAAMLKLYLPDRTPAQIEKYIKDFCISQGDSLFYGEGIPWTGYFAGG